MTSIKAFIDSILGTYVPVSYTDGSVDIIPSGLSGVDWSYVFSGALLLLTFYCIFRIIGGLLSNVKFR